MSEKVINPRETLEKRAKVSSARAIQSFIDRYYPTFQTAEVVSKYAGFTGSDVDTIPNQWAEDGKVFRLFFADQYVYPSFQFDNAGNPRPVIKSILAALRRVPNRDDWGIAVWFGANNGWLGSLRPIDCITTEPNKVVHAAEQDALHHEH